MKRWLSGTRGTIAMILTWIVGWGLGFGGIAELADSAGQILDVWPTVMAVLGLVGGAVFCALFRIAEGQQSFDEVSHARFTLWGAASGFVVGVLSGVTGFPGDFSHPAMMIGTATALGAVAGFGSAVFFRLIATAVTEGRLPQGK